MIMQIVLILMVAIFVHAMWVLLEMEKHAVRMLTHNHFIYVCNHDSANNFNYSYIYTYIIFTIVLNKYTYRIARVFHWKKVSLKLPKCHRRNFLLTFNLFIIAMYGHPT